MVVILMPVHGCKGQFVREYLSLSRALNTEYLISNIFLDLLSAEEYDRAVYCAFY
jgi:hypothetical protein